MEYQEYIKLGFTRTETDDYVEFNQTGYGGFILSREVTHKIFIEVVSAELDTPRLYVRKPAGTCHIFKITPEAVKDLLT